MIILVSLLCVSFVVAHSSDIEVHGSSSILHAGSLDHIKSVDIVDDLAHGGVDKIHDDVCPNLGSGDLEEMVNNTYRHSSGLLF